jgi:signal transduction histidine kinase
MKHLTTRLRDFSRGVKEQHHRSISSTPSATRSSSSTTHPHDQRRRGLSGLKAKHWVKGDRNQIEQIFLNLFSNAATPWRRPNGTNCMSPSSRADVGGRRLVLHRARHGRRHSADKRDAIFKPSSQPSEREGHRLGPSILAHDRREHGGEIELFRSRQGTAFRILLPTLED